MRWSRLREARLVVFLRKGCAEMINQRHVEPVEPDHHAFVFLAVIMPGPGWGHDEVARMHVGALAIDGGVGTAAFDDEAKRRLGMPVRRCDLAALDELDRAGQ